MRKRLVHCEGVEGNDAPAKTKEQNMSKLNEINRFPATEAKHSYNVYVSKTEYVVIDANTRTQAARIAKLHGYKVCSVNMVA